MCLRVHSFRVIWVRISDPRSLRSRYIKGNDESTLVKDSFFSFILMQNDLSDLGSLICSTVVIPLLFVLTFNKPPAVVSWLAGLQLWELIHCWKKSLRSSTR